MLSHVRRLPGLVGYEYLTTSQLARLSRYNGLAGSRNIDVVCFVVQMLGCFCFVCLFVFVFFGGGGEGRGVLFLFFFFIFVFFSSFFFFIFSFFFVVVIVRVLLPLLFFFFLFLTRFVQIQNMWCDFSVCDRFPSNPRGSLIPSS